MPLQVDVAELGGLVGECIIFGMYFILLCRATRSYILRWRRHENVAWPIPVFAGTMFLLTTGQVIADSINIFIAFFHHETRAERIAFLQDPTQAMHAWRYSILSVMVFVADCLVHYRCFIVWQRIIWVVLLQFTLSLGGCICGFVTIGLARSHAILTPQTQSALLTSFFALTFSANVISTGNLRRTSIIRPFLTSLSQACSRTSYGSTIERPRKYFIPPSPHLHLSSASLSNLAL
ncbi:hypothetical protein DENSPDRAFT_408850 [Dentipellis sp. KUC8613]|nr:hypothetical protein DENSPDRAFT_408850 [Dentipellis sp. KUC8613]